MVQERLRLPTRAYRLPSNRCLQFTWTGESIRVQVGYELIHVNLKEADELMQCLEEFIEEEIPSSDGEVTKEGF